MKEIKILNFTTNEVYEMTYDLRVNGFKNITEDMISIECRDDLFEFSGVVITNIKVIDDVVHYNIIDDKDEFSDSGTFKVYAIINVNNELNKIVIAHMHQPKLTTLEHTIFNVSESDNSVTTKFIGRDNYAKVATIGGKSYSLSATDVEIDVSEVPLGTHLMMIPITTEYVFSDDYVGTDIHVVNVQVIKTGGNLSINQLQTSFTYKSNNELNYTLSISGKPSDDVKIVNITNYAHDTSSGRNYWNYKETANDIELNEVLKCNSTKTVILSFKNISYYHNFSTNGIIASVIINATINDKPVCYIDSFNTALHHRPHMVAIRDGGIKFHEPTFQYNSILRMRGKDTPFSKLLLNKGVGRHIEPITINYDYAGLPFTFTDNITYYNISKIADITYPIDYQYINDDCQLEMLIHTTLSLNTVKAMDIPEYGISIDILIALIDVSKYKVTYKITCRDWTKIDIVDLSKYTTTCTTNNDVNVYDMILANIVLMPRLALDINNRVVINNTRHIMNRVKINDFTEVVLKSSEFIGLDDINDTVMNINYEINDIQLAQAICTSTDNHINPLIVTVDIDSIIASDHEFTVKISNINNVNVDLIKIYDSDDSLIHDDIITIHANSIKEFKLSICKPWQDVQIKNYSVLVDYKIDNYSISTMTLCTTKIANRLAITMDSYDNTKLAVNAVGYINDFDSVSISIPEYNLSRTVLNYKQRDIINMLEKFIPRENATVYNIDINVILTKGNLTYSYTESQPFSNTEIDLSFNSDSANFSIHEDTKFLESDSKLIDVKYYIHDYESTRMHLFSEDPIELTESDQSNKIDRTVHAQYVTLPESSNYYKIFQSHEYRIYLTPKDSYTSVDIDNRNIYKYALSNNSNIANELSTKYTLPETYSRHLKTNVFQDNEEVIATIIKTSGWEIEQKIVVFVKCDGWLNAYVFTSNATTLSTYDSKDYQKCINDMSINDQIQFVNLYQYTDDISIMVDKTNNVLVIDSATGQIYGEIEISVYSSIIAFNKVKTEEDIYLRYSKTDNKIIAISTIDDSISTIEDLSNSKYGTKYKSMFSTVKRYYIANGNLHCISRDSDIIIFKEDNIIDVAFIDEDENAILHKSDITLFDEDTVGFTHAFISIKFDKKINKIDINLNWFKSSDLMTVNRLLWLL